MSCYYCCSLQVKKIKSIYHALNMFNLDVTQRCLIAECWCPVEDLDQIQQALTTGTVSRGQYILTYQLVHTLCIVHTKARVCFVNEKQTCTTLNLS